MLKKILIILFTLSTIKQVLATQDTPKPSTQAAFSLDSNRHIFFDQHTENPHAARELAIWERDMANASLMHDMKHYNGALLGTTLTSIIFLNNAVHSKKFPKFSFTAMCAAASYTFYLGYLASHKYNSPKDK